MRRLAYSLICASLLFIPIFTADAAVLRTPPNNLGLVGYWSMEDGSGSTATDFSGSGNNGTLTNMDASTDWVSGKRGTALDFDGNDDYVNIGDKRQSTPWTFSVWLNASDNKVSTAVVGGTTDNGDTALKFEQWKETKKIGYSERNIDDYTFSEETPFGVWTHLVWVGTNSDTAIYVNGTKRDTNNNSIPLDYDTLGRWRVNDNDTPGDPIKGKIDEVRVYNRALSSSEVRDLYQSGYAEINRTAKVEEVGDPVGWWTFDGRDMDLSGSGGTSTDATGNGNDGELIGSLDSGAVKPGRIGQSLTFDGNDDYIKVPDTGSFDFGPAFDITVSTWVKTDQGYSCGANSDNKVAIGYRVGTPQWWLGCNQSTDEVRWSVRGSNNNINEIVGTSKINDGQWHHIVGRLDNSTDQTAIFVDGKKETEEALTITGDLSGDAEVCIGTYGNDCTGFSSADWNGKVDDPRVYDKALSADEIQKIYDATRPSEVNASQDTELTDGLVGMWSFDGPSIDFSGSPPTAEDVSANSNTGMLQNGPTDAIGNIGQALNFDGSDDNFDTNYDPVYATSTGFAISTWYKLDTDSHSSDEALFHATDDNTGTEIGIEIDGDGSACEDEAFTVIVAAQYDTPDNNYICTNTKTDTQWHHMLLNFDPGAGKMNVYVDGQEDSSGGGEGNSIDGTVADGKKDLAGTPIYVGAFNDGGTAKSYLNGKIDNLRIYDRALSESEINRLYNLGR